MKDIQTQYDAVLQSVYNMMHAEWLISNNDVDEMEICCELVELYEKIYSPMEG